MTFLAPVPAVSPPEAQRLIEQGAVLIDVREEEEHAQVRIPGARLLPMSWIQSWWQDLPTDGTVILQCRTGVRSEQAVAALIQQAGRTNVVNLDGGIVEWYEEGLPITTGPPDEPAFVPPYGRATPTDVARDLEKGAVRWLVDVRDDLEWRSGHIDGAVHIPLAQLPLRLHEVPRGEPVVVVCRTGQRSALAAQALIEAGCADVRNLVGGIEAWQADGLPVQR